MTVLKISDERRIARIGSIYSILECGLWFYFTIAIAIVFLAGVDGDIGGNRWVNGAVSVAAFVGALVSGSFLLGKVYDSD